MSKKSLFARSLPQVPSNPQVDPPSQTSFSPFISLLPKTQKPPPAHKSIPKSHIVILFAVSLAESLTIHIVDSYATTHEENPHKLLYQGLSISLILASFALVWLGLVRIPHGSRLSRSGVLLLSSLCFFSTVFLTRFIFAQRAFIEDSTSDWCSLSFSLIPLISTTILADLLFQQWLLKLIPPLGNLGALIVAYIFSEEGNLKYEWISMVISVMAMIIFMILKCRAANRLRSRNYENETWNEMYSLILNQIPSAVVIMDNGGRITYSNQEYTKLSLRYETNLFEKIVFVKNNNSDAPEVSSLPKLSPKISPKIDQTDSHIALTKQFEEDIDRINSDCEAANSPLSPYSLGKTKSLLEVIQSVQGTDQTETIYTFRAKLVNSEGLYPPLPLDVKIYRLTNRSEIVLILSEVASRDLLLPLENANEYKNKLLATVSHEMRTPLNGNLTLIESAMNDKGTSSYLKEKFLVPAYRSGQLLWHLVNDVLDVAQIQARKLRLSFARLPLRSTIENCCKLVELKAQAKGVNLIMDCSPDMPEYFNTDHNRLSQIILNLLSNALKFTFSGEVRLKVHVIGPSLLEFTVKDTGIGMTKEDVEKLFRHFTRINYGKRKNINTTGVGLGLSIANNLVKMLGAPHSRGINVRSAPDQGSSFSFLLKEAQNEEEDANEPLEAKDNPFQQNPHIDLHYANSNSPTTQEGGTDAGFECITPSNRYRKPYQSPSPKNLRRIVLNPTESRFKAFLKGESFKKKKGQETSRTVLVVDDEPFNVIAVEAILKTFGMKIEGAYNGKEAIDKVLKKTRDHKQGSYEMILMDCQMPLMNGYETVKVLRDLFKENEIQEIPIIGCSGYQDKEHYMNCLQSGMNEVLVKPISREKVCEIIKKYIKNFDLMVPEY